MKIAVAQLNPTIGALDDNVATILQVISRARLASAHLVVFPELVVTGYPPRDLLLYDAFLDAVEQKVLEEIVPATEGVNVVLGVPWREPSYDGLLFNSALLLKDGKILSVHSKTLLPNYDVFDENRYFYPASQRSLAFIEGHKVAITVCEDIWNDKDFFGQRFYQEDPLEELLAQDVDLLINISASPYHLGKASYREKMFRSLASKYSVGLFFVNQVGGNDELIFDGNSVVCSSNGHQIYQAEAFQEALFYCESDSYEITEDSFLSDCAEGVKNEAEAEEEGVGSVYRALQLGIKDYLRKTGFAEVAIGLSGGIDSAVTAALAVVALGPENVLGIMMPSRYSSDHSLLDSETLSDNLQIKSKIISIEEPFKAFMKILNVPGDPVMDLADENIQARIRGNILMFISNRENRLVLSTGNKSELAVGYCTLYGDMCGGLAVLADVPKGMVYQLARYINDRAGKDIIPRSVINKEPSAELRPAQKDQDSLPSYRILDKILHSYIEENKYLEELKVQGFQENLAGEVLTMVDRSEHKRFQSAPGLRVTKRAFGSGRRMPLVRGVFHNMK